MAAGVTFEDPATAYVGERHDRRRHRDRPERHAARADAHRTRLPARRHRVAARRDARRRRAPSLRLSSERVPRSATTRSSDRSRTCGRARVLAAARPHRQLRRDQEGDARRGHQGESPDLPRRLRDRRATPTSAPAPSPATTTASRSIARVIGARVQIGSDTQLVAPVTVGDDAYVGAGTTVTRDVPAGHWSSVACRSE